VYCPRGQPAAALNSSVLLETYPAFRSRSLRWVPVDAAGCCVVSAEWVMPVLRLEDFQGVSWARQQHLQPDAACIQLPGDTRWRVIIPVRWLRGARRCSAVSQGLARGGLLSRARTPRGYGLRLLLGCLPSRWDVGLDGLIPGAAALCEAGVNIIYTGVVALLTPAFWLPSGS